MSRVVVDLINSCPALADMPVSFATLDAEHGLAVFPITGAAIVSEREDVTGHVTQNCTYPFTLMYRVALRGEERRLAVKELLDTVGRWLELQPVEVAGETYKLDAYPDLTSSGRRVLQIQRTTPGYLASAYEDGVEDWAISAALSYENDFNK